MRIVFAVRLVIHASSHALHASFQVLDGMDRVEKGDTIAKRAELAEEKRREAKEAAVDAAENAVKGGDGKGVEGEKHVVVSAAGSVVVEKDEICIPSCVFSLLYCSRTYKHTNTNNTQKKHTIKQIEIVSLPKAQQLTVSLSRITHATAISTAESRMQRLLLLQRLLVHPLVLPFACCLPHILHLLTFLRSIYPSDPSVGSIR
jgi:hypothetical protein